MQPRRSGRAGGVGGGLTAGHGEGVVVDAASGDSEERPRQEQEEGEPEPGRAENVLGSSSRQFSDSAGTSFGRSLEDSVGYMQF